MYIKLIETLYQFALEYLYPSYLPRDKAGYHACLEMKDRAMERLKRLLSAEAQQELGLYTEHRDEQEGIESEAVFLSGLAMGLSLNPPYWD